MKKLAAPLLAGAVVLSVSSIGWAQPRLPGWAQPYGEAAQTAGRQIFHDHCSSCHLPKSAQRLYGPTLSGVVGRPAGSVPGFPYSDALKKSGITWTEDNLKKWVANTAAVTPGTLMPHVSIADPAEQTYLIAYLKTLKAR